MTPNKIKTEVAVIGGGAAGLIAAAEAAKRGRKTLLIEKNSRTGRKLLITGKGRCNLTNNRPVEELMSSVVGNGKFLYSAFSSFSPEDTMNLFESLGVSLKTERGGRVFPVSDKAMDIADALLNYAKKSGVKFLFSPAERIEKEDLFYITTRETEVIAESVIIATGGKSYPLTGSSGDGYLFAKSLSHSVVPPRAALIPLITKEKDAAEMQGLSLKNVKLSLIKEGKKKPVFEDMGEMLFTHFGVSGPLVLTASCYIDTINDFSISIDLKPALTPEKLDMRIVRDFSENPNKSLRNILPLLLPSKMIAVVLKRAELTGEEKANSISAEKRRKLIETIKNLTFKIEGTRPIEEAIITSGGVSLKEIDPKTMQSKLVSGLFFAGEVIDAHAFTGGYNLQIAFSTGYKAGKNA